VNQTTKSTSWRFDSAGGLFTDSTALALKAIRTRKVGGVNVGGTSNWRTDQMPYGGIKASGIGREGPRYAIGEMTDERLVVFNAQRVIRLSMSHWSPLQRRGSMQSARPMDSRFRGNDGLRDKLLM